MSATRPGRVLERVSLAVYRAAIWAYPRAFRTRFGGELACVFADRIRAASQRRPALGWAAAAWGVADALGSGLALRLGGTGSSVASQQFSPRSQGMFITAIHHLRHAARQLRRAPAFTAAAAISLAIGIGANTAIFSVANGLLLAPTAGIPDLDRLVDVGRTTGGQGFDTVSFPTYLDVAARGEVFERVAAIEFGPRPLSLGAADGAERIFGQQVSASYFDVLGIRPELGTFFVSAQEAVGTPLRKVVLSHGFWRRRFGGDRSIVGREVVLNGDPFVVAGVTRPDFHGTIVIAPDLWVPLTAGSRGFPTDATLRSRASSSFIMLARLRPGSGIAQAQAALDALTASQSREYPEIYRDRGLKAMPSSRLPGIGSDLVAPFVAVLMALVVLVLLVTCTNLTGLLLARATARRTEMAVRLALGGSRSNLAGMLVAETLLLFLIGASAGLFAAYWLTGVLSRVVTEVPTPGPVQLAFPMDWRVLTFTLLVASIAGLLTGLAPALQATRPELSVDLKSDASAPRRQRLRSVFVAVQLAFSVTLIVVAGLLVRALQTASSADPGMAVAGLDVVSVDLQLGNYPDDGRSATATEALQARLAALPGVARVGAISLVPLEGSSQGQGDIRRAGELDALRMEADWAQVTAEYFAAVDIPIVQGRAFAADDRRDAPHAVIVNQQFARNVWPNENPVGKVLENGDFREGQAGEVVRLTVVGVARDASYRWIGEAPRPFIYQSLAQSPSQQVYLFVRRSVTAGSFETAYRDVFRQFDRNLPIVKVAPFARYAEIGLLPQRIAASLSGGLSLVALLLAAVGIYGVASYGVASRTREFGLRSALGADRRRIFTMVLWQSARLVAIGGSLGMGLALVAGQALESLLFGISPTDGVTLATTVVTLSVVAVLASLGPALRAARIEPATALRD